MSLDTQHVTFALDETTGDLAVPVVLLRGVDAIRQRLKVRFQWFRGEWFLDARQGVPYFRDVFEKNADLFLVDSLLRRVLLLTPGIATVRTLSSTLNEATRTLSVNFDAVLDDGSPFTSAAAPFILDLP